MVSIYLSIEDAKAIARIDNVDRNQHFVEENALQVKVALNTYLAMLKGDLHFTEGDVYTVKVAFKRLGLSKVVRGCQEIAEFLMMGYDDWSTVSYSAISYDALLSVATEATRPIIAGLYNVHQLNHGASSLDSMFMHSHNVSGEAAAVMQALLFLERFTYKSAQSSIDCFKKFISVNAKCRSIETNWSRWPGQSIMWQLRSAMEDIYTRETYHYDINECHFSSGSTTDSKRDKGQMGKWSALSKTETCYMRDITMPLPGGENGRRDINRFPRLTAVPKKLTSRRCIAPEDASCNYFAYGALEALRKMLCQNGTIRFINEQDQSVNRNLAKIGSTPEGEWATIDMSSASDSISAAIFMALIPEWYRPVIAEYSSSCFSVDLGTGTEVRSMYTLFTSGNPLTWLTESTYFLAIARVACSLCGYTGSDRAFVYGDDIVIHKDYYVTCCELLQALGHTVNARKSYYTGAFRESCGGWYFRGYDVTPVFWPRHDLVPDKSSGNVVRDLCSLQHNLLIKGRDFAAAQVEREVRELYKGITKSAYGSTYGDLWSRELDASLDGARPHTVVTQKKEHAKHNPLIDHVLYYQFLQFGPMHDSALDELLGITSSRTETMYTLVRDETVIYTMIPDHGVVERELNPRKPREEKPQKARREKNPTGAEKSAKPVKKQAPAKPAPTTGRPQNKGGKVGHGDNHRRTDVAKGKAKQPPKAKQNATKAPAKS